MLRLAALIPAVLACATETAFANEFRPVNDKDEFLALLQGRDLRIGMYDLTLRVLADGRITGAALGQGVTGTWAWKSGFFCREMDWSGYPIDYNCQLVEYRDDGQMRFTVDKGAGQSARFTLR